MADDEQMTDDDRRSTIDDDGKLFKRRRSLCGVFTATGYGEVCGIRAAEGRGRGGVEGTSYATRRRVRRWSKKV